MQSFYIDERVGCVAVRDRRVPCRSEGLMPDLPGVVKYWSGERVMRICTKCQHEVFMHWNVSQESLSQATELCKKLNQEDA